MMREMRTTVDIHDATLAELRQLADRNGRSLRAVLEETLRLGLVQQSKPSPSPQVTIRPHALHVKPGFAKMSFNQLYDQVEAERQLGRDDRS